MGFRCFGKLPRGMACVPEFGRLEITHSSEDNADLEPGKSVEDSDWDGKDAGAWHTVRAHSTRP